MGEGLRLRRYGSCRANGSSRRQVARQRRQHEHRGSVEHREFPGATSARKARHQQSRIGQVRTGDPQQPRMDIGEAAGKGAQGCARAVKPNRIASPAFAWLEYIKAATAMPAAAVIAKLAFSKVEISASATASSLPRVNAAGAPSKAPAALRQNGTTITGTRIVRTRPPAASAGRSAKR